MFDAESNQSECEDGSPSIPIRWFGHRKHDSFSFKTDTVLNIKDTVTLNYSKLREYLPNRPADFSQVYLLDKTANTSNTIQ